MNVIAGEPKKGLPLPGQIKLQPSGAVIGGFGKSEVEVVAGHLVQFFKEEKGAWVPFTLTELAKFYRQKGWNPDVMLFGLAGGWFDDGMIMGGWKKTAPSVAFDKDGQARVTEEFVKRCAAEGCDDV